MIKNLKKELAILFSLLFICSCGEVQLITFEKNFSRIQITNAKDSATLILFIQLHNETPDNQEISAIEYDLFIDEKLCGHGELKESIIIVSGESKKINLPLWVPYNQVDKVTKSVLENRLINPNYSLEATLIFLDKKGKEKQQDLVITNK